MASNFLTNLLQKAKNVPTNIGNALLGTPVQMVQPQSSVAVQYPEAMQQFMNELPNQDYAKSLYNQPKQTQLTNEQINEGIANGLNFGIPQIATAQKQWGINIPKTGEEIDLAKIGQFNQYPKTLQTGTANEPRQGGILRDFARGYRDNYDNGMNINQWGDKSNWATRLGEGLGSVGRFVDSPVGRFAITAGTIGALGGTPTEMAAYGVTAGVGRQQNRLQDQVYRRDLINQMQNSLRNSEEYINADEATQNQMLADIENQVNGYRGNMTSDVYKNMLASQQLRDNAAYRNLMLTNQQEQNRIANEMKNIQMQANIEDKKLQRAYQQQQLGLGYARLNADNFYKNEALKLKKEQSASKNKQDKATQKQFSENMATIADIDRGLELIKQNPGAYTFLKGKMGADLANRIDPKGVKTRTQIDNITAVYRKWLTGAQMSDAERKAYERFLPAPSDNAQIVQAKLEGMRDSIQRKNDVLMYGATQGQQADNDPLGIL